MILRFKLVSSCLLEFKFSLFIHLLSALLVSLPGGTWDMVLEFGEPVQVTASIGGNPVKDTVPETVLRILNRAK